MQAVILHAEGDEFSAAEVAGKLAPASAAAAPLTPESGAAHDETLALFALWSARAEAQGLSQALSRVAARAGGRAIVVRTDGAPLPPLPTGARVLTVADGAGTYAHALGFALSRAPQPAPQSRPARARAVIGGWTPGVSIGLAIYAGMFVVAGAWRSEEVTEAVENGRAVPLAAGLHSFQTVAAAGVGRIQVALAPTAPSAAFVQPQRVILTGTLDTNSIPIVAEAPAVTVAAADYVPPPVRLHPIETAAPIPASYAPAGAPIEAAIAMPLMTADLGGVVGLIAPENLPSLDVGANEF